MSKDKVRLVLLVKADIKNKLDEVAAEYGMSTSAYVTYIVGQHLKTVDMVKPMLETMGKSLPDAILQLMPREKDKEDRG